MDFSKKYDRPVETAPVPDAALSVILHSLGYGDYLDIQALSGGYSNFNYKVTCKSHNSVVLRCCKSDNQAFQTEVDIMRLAGQNLPVPEVLNYRIVEGQGGWNAAIIEFIEGDVLSDIEDDLSSDNISIIAEDLGRILARIHSMKFGCSGFLGAGAKVDQPFKSFAQAYESFFKTSLQNDYLKLRLGKDLIQKTKKYMSNALAEIERLSATPCLVHSDFNQKNILVNKIEGNWRVAAILDWEYAFSGHGLVDFGNFFRFEDELRAEYQLSLVKGYQAQGGALPENWREMAKALDMLAALEFLCREGDRPKTYETAVSIIRKTVT